MDNVTEQDVVQRVSGQVQTPEMTQPLQMMHGDHPQQVIAEVQAVQSHQPNVRQLQQPASPQPEVNQHRVVVEVRKRQTRTASLQEAQRAVITGWEGAGAEESQPVTRALIGTIQATHQLVIVLRAHNDTVTQTLDIKAHSGPAASVKARARVGVACCLVLPTRAVEDAVAADVDRQTVAVPRALEVGPRATRRRQNLHSEPAQVVKDHHGRGWEVLGVYQRQSFDVAAVFVRTRCTVLFPVTQNFTGKALRMVYF